MKKLFQENKMVKKRLVEFLDKRGFYVVLVLCLLIIGATTVYVTTHNITSPNTNNLDAQNIIPEDIGEASAISGQDKATMQSSMNSAPSVTVQNQTQTKTQNSYKDAGKNTNNSNKGNNSNSTNNPNSNKSTTGKNTTSTDKTSAKATSAAASQKFIIPVFGQVSFGYAKDKLVYSKTLEEWRTHSGVDIAAERGTVVKATSAGVVSEVKNDPRWGILVVVDHQNGLKTVYGNLASDEVVSANQKIKQGDIIGSIGNTASFESSEQPHLHFEVWKNGEPVDPSAYLPKK
ncbi:MAG: M23 family metallopeptidase [Clostridia bacterium]|nr:M23 family metallopeptidase [Clostridia bacterium]